jgi:hypothetical protein
MKFVTNKINLQPGNFADFVKKTLAKNLVKTAEKDEAESSGQPEAEAKLVNDPKKEGGKSGKADNSEAPSSGQPEAEAKLVNKPKVECDTNEKVKKAGGKPFGGKQAPPFKKKNKKGDDNDDSDDSKCEKCDCSPCECDKKEASRKISFVKLSALNGPTKEMLRTYWRTLYPADYVDAMLAEK